MKLQKLSQCGLNRNQVSSPLGPWNVLACNAGLHLVKLSEEVTNENFLNLGCKQVNLKDETKNEHIQKFESWMQLYFSDEKVLKMLQNTPILCEQIVPLKEDTKMKYRQKVWVKLKETVKFGETISYGDLAKLCSDDGKSSAASRAVGGAMANNPISLIIPCHRVVKSDGSAGNYSKCTKNSVKQWLLSHEKNLV